MTTPLTVLIAANGQPELLRRTLDSLAACPLPPGFRGATIVENGQPCGLDRVARQAPAGLCVEYLYSEPANKSLSLNLALRRLAGSLVLFTDDDVRFAPTTLTAYAAAAIDRRGGEFYGGEIVPDYEASAPAEWLRPYLPRSAGGWNLPVTQQTGIRRAEFIGPNFCAFADDVLRVGGFDTRLGPGQQMVSPGEDTEIQERLLAHGLRGYYVPGAAMHHWVRAASVTTQFALHRAERNGIYWGISQARSAGFFPRRWLKTGGQWLNDCWRIARWRRSGDPVAMFRADFTAARWRGRWQGIRLGRRWSMPPPGEELPATSLIPPVTDRRAA
jgi:GT2 family glycosyltransferase